MPQNLGGAGPLMLLFGLFSSIFMFFFRPLIHFVLNIIARRYTGLSANDIRNMNVGSSITALRSAVSNFTERPAVSSHQPNYSTTILLQSEVCGQLDFQKLRASPSSTIAMDDPFSIFVLPQADPRENDTLARFRAIMARDAVCVDPRFGRAWRVPVDAATALSKANQLGFVTVSSCSGNNNVNTWTMACVDKSKPSEANTSRSRSIENRASNSLSSAQRLDDRASTPGPRSTPEYNGAEGDSQNNVLPNNLNTSQIRRRQPPSVGGNTYGTNNNNNGESGFSSAVTHGLSGDEYTRQYPVLGQQ